ncbi:MAG: hypothetical protein LBR69_02045 [Endomicrobium sp.]|jgi:hypothetical protein|nr:hypothetical protein [Endomicrobium sp.]
MKNVLILINKEKLFRFKLPAAYIFIFFLTFALYAPTLKFGITSPDDVKLVKVLAPVYERPYSIALAFVNNVFYDTDTYVFYYRPMLSLSFIIDSKIVKALEAASISVSTVNFAHFTNIILHCLCAVLVFFFFRRYLFDFKLSFAAASLFAAHPIALQTVAWIPGRNDSLLLMFFIPCFAFFIDYLRTKDWHFLFLHMLFLLFCLGTKESAVVVVPLLFLYYFLDKKNYSKLNAGIYVLWTLVLAAFFLVKSAVVPGQFQNMLKSEGSLAFLQNCAGFLDMLSAIVFFRAPSAEHIEIKIIILGIISVLMILFFAFWKADEKLIKQNAFCITAILMFFIPSFVVMRFFFQANRIYEGFFFILIIIFSFISRLKDKQKNIAVFIISFLIILSSYITFKHEYIYKDDLSMWGQIVGEAPQVKLLPVLFYTDALVRRSRFDEALQILTLFAQQTGFDNISVLARIEQIYKLRNDNENALKVREFIDEKLKLRFADNSAD